MVFRFPCRTLCHTAKPEPSASRTPSVFITSQQLTISQHMHTVHAMPSKVWRIVSVVIKRAYHVQNDKKWSYLRPGSQSKSTPRARPNHPNHITTHIHSASGHAKRPSQLSSPSPGKSVTIFGPTNCRSFSILGCFSTFEPPFATVQTAEYVTCARSLMLESFEDKVKRQVAILRKVSLLFIILP
jgi:hypothetical protein